jgi:manganese/zinc/iron transport system permease protein
MSARSPSAWAVTLLLLVFFLDTAQAARINEITETTTLERAVRFFSFRDPSLRYALAGSILLGACCGVMGGFLVVRRLSLMGDSLSHAVLPGVALGFLWNMTKDPVAIFIGAVVVGLLGAGTVQVIRSTTRHKEDAALGFVLASFFAVGICLFTMIQNLPGGNKSGLDKFMFGQAASLSSGDVWLLAAVTLLVLGAVLIFYKEYVLTSFDAGFARSIGMKVPWLDYSLMLLLSFAIVSALQAVGIVLVSAMLVIPAAAAFMLTDRFRTMLLLSACFGMTAAALGAFSSFVGRNLPTGPFMVLSASAVFALALFFGPRHGIVSRWWRRRSQSARIGRENMLKALYHIQEGSEVHREHIPVSQLAERRRTSLDETYSALADLQRHHQVTLNPDRSVVSFTPEGWQRACEIVRNHRLWELYLTQSARYAADHVHDDAEAIEHVLSEATVMRLEKELRYARTDPHGKLIPGIEDMRRGTAAATNRSPAILPAQP